MENRQRLLIEKQNHGTTAGRHGLKIILQHFYRLYRETQYRSQDADDQISQ